MHLKLLHTRRQRKSGLGLSWPKQCVRKPVGHKAIQSREVGLFSPCDLQKVTTFLNQYFLIKAGMFSGSCQLFDDEESISFTGVNAERKSNFIFS